LPGPNQTDKLLDDLFDGQKPPSQAPPQAAPPQAPPVAPPLPPQPAAPSLFAHAPEPASIQSRLDTGPVAPPEPPITDKSDTELADTPFRQFAESSTVFVPPPNLRIPPEVEPTGEDWFSKEDEPDAHFATGVEDDERMDDGGTIFTEHTTPIPAEMIRSLDESQPPSAPSRHGLAEPAAEEYEAAPEAYKPAAEAYEPVAEAYEPAAETYHQPAAETHEPAAATYRPAPEARQPVAEDYEPVTEIYQRAPDAYEPAAHNAYEPVSRETYMPAHEAYQPQPEPESGRSLFEPVVPVAEAAHAEGGEAVPPGPFGPGSAMPLPGGGSPAPEFNVKASVTALRYCTQDNPQFERIMAEVWFRTPSDAERVGFRMLS
jgi:hypothetical protein